MKNNIKLIFRTLLLSIPLFSQWSCTQELTIDPDAVPIVSEKDFRIHADTENPSLTHFDFTKEGVTPYWKIQLSETEFHETSERHFTLTLSEGDYSGTLREYGRNGMSEEFPLSFNVTIDFTSLLCGTNDDKVWVWDRYGKRLGDGQRILGYVWGEPMEKNCWFYTLETLENGDLMNDELSFRKDGRFQLDAKGFVWRDYKVEGSTDPKLPWEPKGTEAWEIIKKDSKNYIQFSGGGFPSVLLSKEDGIDGSFLLHEISKDVLKLHYIVSPTEYTELNFVSRDYVPEEKPEPEPEPQPAIPELNVTPLPEDAQEIKLLTSKIWKLGPEYEYRFEQADSYEIRLEAKDDRIEFKPDNKVIISAGADGLIMNEGAEGGLMKYDPSSTAGWTLGHVAEMGPSRLFLKFTGGGYPCIMPIKDGTDLVWEVRELKEDSIALYFDMGDGCNFVVYLIPEDRKEPEFPIEEGLSELLKTHSWTISLHGWYGEGWEYMEPILPDCHKDDVLRFLADGKFVLDQGQDNAILYDDANSKTEPLDPLPVITGKETWKIVKDGKKDILRLANGGFPGIIPDKSAIDGGDYIIRKLPEGTTVRLEYWQKDKDQFMTIDLTGTPLK